MKSKSFFFMIYLLLTISFSGSYGQVGISDTGAIAPNPGAVFELSSESKGVLLPRLTTIQLKAIYLPPDGLLVYNTDSSMFFYYDSSITSWRNFAWGDKIIAPNCGSPLSDDRDGKSYSTVLIGSQCWMGENLDIGDMIAASQLMLNNYFIEKYCYNNSLDSCNKFGALYSWDEMMQYSIIEGTQGICPDEWHLPTDEEWKTLEGTVDSQYGVGDPIWDNIADRGFDVGKNLKSTSGWYLNGNGTDSFGFTALPGGLRFSTNGNIYHIGEFGYFWTSAQYDNDDAVGRILRNATDDSYWNIDGKSAGYSVRCIKDN